MAHRRQACRLEIRLREAPVADDPGRRYVETYCYAFAAGDFLKNEWQKLYWRTAIVQMTRYYMSGFTRHRIRTPPEWRPGCSMHGASSFATAGRDRLYLVWRRLHCVGGLYYCLSSRGESQSAR
jgi:hypothetical protein